jgi:hypothetical protein
MKKIKSLFDKMEFLKMRFECFSMSNRRRKRNKCILVKKKELKFKIIFENE